MMKNFPINPPRGSWDGEGAGSGVVQVRVGSEVGVGTDLTQAPQWVQALCRRRLTVPDHIRLFDLALAGNQ